MSRVLMFTAILLFAVNVYAKGADNTASIQATTYADGVLIEAKNSGTDIHLNVSGPANTYFEKRQSSSGAIFIDVNRETEAPLPDGLYKYEAQAIPAFTISREESSQLSDRNVLRGKTDPKASPVSGNFRILNGMVVDPDINEFDAGSARGQE